MYDFTSKKYKKMDSKGSMKKSILSVLIASTLLAGCGGDKNTQDAAVPLNVTTTFTARHIQTLPGKQPENVLVLAGAEKAERMLKASQVRYNGKLEVTQVGSNEAQVSTGLSLKLSIAKGM